MHFITFIYKIKNINRTFYGKYVVEYISDDHDGLDNEIRPVVLYVINIYRTGKGLSILNNGDLQIGILSFSFKGDFSTHSSNDEIECFDFYYESDYSYYGHFTPAKMFINGNIVNSSDV